MQTESSASEKSGMTSSSRGHHRRSRMRRFTRRVRKFLKLRVIIVVLLIMLVIPSAVAVAFIADANARVQESWTSLRRVMSTLNGRSIADLTSSDIERLRVSVVNLSKDLARAKQQTSFIRPFSNLNADVNAKLSVLDVAHEITLGASDMLTGLQPTLFSMLGTEKGERNFTQSSSIDRIVDLLGIGQSSFVNAGEHISKARAQLAALNLGEMSLDLLLTSEDIARYAQQLDDTNKILLNGPEILSQVLGVDSPQDYLILSQNSDELRPSGGYISTFGWMRVRRASVVDYGYSPTTKTSPNPPPSELASQLDIPKWWIQYSEPIYMAWDGSWYADFPSTAKMAAWFYDNGNNPRSPVGGVVALDVAAFEYILKAIGPVTVSEYNETVSAETFRTVIYKIREGDSDVAGDVPHKRFLAALYKQILSQWQTMNEQHGDVVFSAILRALKEKHIMLYFKDEKLNEAVRVLGWDGKQVTGPNQDYLMVADANLGSKSNRSIARNLTYDVDILADGSLQSRATITYDFSAQVAEKDPAVNPRNYNNINYFNSMQVFVPAGSTLTGTKDLQTDVNTVNTPSYTDFATVTEVKYDSTARYQFSYTTPVVVEQLGQYRRYRFLAQKQPGMLNEGINVQVSLPEGAVLVNASPQPATNFQLGRTILEFRGQLTTDFWIELLYKVN